MTITVSGLVAAWIEGLRPDAASEVVGTLASLQDGKRRYIHDTSGSPFDGLRWHAVTLTRKDDFVDATFHYGEVLFATDCAAGRVIVVVPGVIPQTVLHGLETDATGILGSYEITLPPVRLIEGSSAKGVTSLVLSVENREMGRND